MPHENDTSLGWNEILPAGRPFLKMQGLRNHFVIVDGRADAYRPQRDEIVRICDVQTGIGADQLVVIEPPAAAGAAAFVRFYNVDGPEAEACGNATRCAAWLLMREANTNSISLETRNGILDCDRIDAQLVRCGMGELTMDWRKIPLTEERDTCHLGIGNGALSDPVAVAIGNPHAVFFVADLNAIDLEILAPPLQKHPLFPQQVNVGAAQMLSEDTLRLAVYERGAGLTTACGSGACAAVYAALARGLTDVRTMCVEMPAGSVKVEILADGSAAMTGPVALCFSGYLQPPLQRAQ
ncbi:MAG: diaminopimelate epimerase [Gammaproteobacteria bacterium]|nr:MAG: diaminopimelate epimerase [Gammaproteobacteria bacterium]